jgi:hypothetical protein
MLLLPFVVIRLVGHERQTGAWKLLLQARPSVATQLGVKLVVLFGAWVVAWLPVLLALVLWRGAGNHLDWREIGAVALGHWLFGAFTMGVAAAATVLTRNEASAAIVTLGITIGTWAVDFAGAVQGGVFRTLARFTPTAVLHHFEQGLVRVGDATVLLVVSIVAFAVAAVMLDWRQPTTRRRARLTGLAVGGLALLLISSRVRASADWSEDQRNSFSPADAALLGRIRDPLRIEAHLAPEDPRRADFERGVVAKLERAVPEMSVAYSSASRTGMFEAPGTGYGEIWYRIDERRKMSRSTTGPIVLELIYELAGMTAPTPQEPAYPGYPLVRAPKWIWLWLFVLWPGVIALSWFGARARYVTREH